MKPFIKKRDPSERTMYSPKELAERWGCKVQTLANRRSQGKFPVFLKIGGSVRYHIDDIERHEARKDPGRAGQVGQTGSGDLFER